MDKLKLEHKIIKVLKTIYDPEIHLNIYDLGLIYNIEIDDNKNVEITMTLTAPNCPEVDYLLYEMKEKVESLKEIEKMDIMLVFDPPWNKDLLSEEARLELGIL